MCQIIQLREKAGELKLLKIQDHLYLTRARIGYIPDFKCQHQSGRIIHIEAKGYANDRWPIIKQLWPYYGPNALEIWMGNYRNPQLSEIIIPL